ncbi:nicotinate-nucleotide--dimethylbenzimidazole phosphoribosyltransferase [Paenibacillus sp. JX-17]|uniref:Nicotinate-nucleotide--dimethylbenzimidazole phosphoribosyltransferase n=1 Tax=Paenibacillus lacisoli TaxID=3064525 RepID=A0ABT9CDJ1_9BACL|nr:nicotinate-nucleotide--dimethylbenzimidazole phosphoribosyltransferase [Paenibacillus sp. JX-17]MDO7907335.1 nicotinate-nucleotide--dimethylbenzimidazole phosphoribosyltransferase [Paenibacillus sp. JX-17]
MTEQLLLQQIQEIQPLDQESMNQASAHLDQLTKPQGSLGKLESLAIQLAGITGTQAPLLERRSVIVMAADHGIASEGVSAYPAEVTPQMLLNMLHGGAAVNVLARQASAHVVCVDIGVNADIEHPRLHSRSIRKGTANMAEGPAMSRDEAVRAIRTGMEIAADEVRRGTSLFVTGELGIGNTTASAALISALTGLPPARVVGRGTGLDDAGVHRKTEAIRRSLERNRCDATDPVGVLAAVGGLEIGGLAGVILGAALHQCPVMLDGFISAAAALLAVRLAPACAAYMIASHQSDEKGHAAVLEQLGLQPMLQLDMRLGEGTGGVLALHLVDAANRIMREMATFASAGVAGASGEVPQ